MGYEIKQSSTAYPLIFMMVDSADHITGKTGLTCTVTIRKVGGAFASPAGAVTEIGNGFYQVAGNATDSATLGPLLLHSTAAAADPTDDVYSVVAFDPQDAAGLGLSRIDAAISTRSTYAGADTSGTTTLLSRIGGSISLSGGAVTVGTNNDKTGYTLSAAGVQAVWDALTSALTTVGSVGKRIGDFLTGDAFVRLGAPAGASTAADIASIKTDTGTTILGRLPAALVSGRMDVSVGAYQTGMVPLQPATAGRTLVVDAAGLADANMVKMGPTGLGTAQTARDIGASVLLSSGTGAGQLSFTAGILKVDVDTIKTNPVVNAGTITFPTGATLASTSNITTVGAVSGAVGSVTGNVGGNVVGSVASVTAAVTLPSIPANWITAAGLDATAGAEIADAVWDEVLSGHLTAGTTGNALNAAGAAGDPWTTALPGAYGAGTAGNIIGNNVNATISSRSTYAGGDTSGTTTLLSRIGASITITSGKVDVNDKTGFSLSAGGVQAIWDALTSALTTVGSVGKRIGDFLTGDAYARIGANGAGLTALGDTRLANLDASVSSRMATFTYTLPLDAAGTRAALGMASANFDTQISGLATSAQALAIKGKTDNLPTDPADASDVAAAFAVVNGNITALNDISVADIIAGVSEGSLDLQEMLRIILAGVAGKSNSHQTGAPKYRDQADTKNRISATVDVNGNRTAVTVDGT